MLSTSSPLLVLDTGSPLVSVAVGRGGEVLASRSVELSRSSRQLLPLIDEALAEAGLRPRDLGGIAALRGPGSFTGLRIGLATVLGLHQALEVAATAVSTLHVLAASVLDEGTVIAAVDALRGDWSAQAFTGAPLRYPSTEMELVAGGDLPRLAGGGPAVVVGFGVSRLGELPGWPAEIALLEAGPLAPAAVRLLASATVAGIEWEPDLLVDPLYSRPPAVTLPKRRTAPAPPSSII
ncbi:MAG TPA: tRNA (adenosine(37)-N6)-threonylcarbamoyltransferase complex dimerization subunit type 1 TsaB [Thermoanaerobaculia bacterium]|nr:tRNA (adenosine(37)-N6)-threonylcarbamoyltransferase complex dimerization subunit type 1 TsaB [Thermoanaerobaculia bacterium]